MRFSVIKINIFHIAYLKTFDWLTDMTLYNIVYLSELLMINNTIFNNCILEIIQDIYMLFLK